MSVRIQMHAYEPRAGYVLQQFRANIEGRGFVTFEAGRAYTVDEKVAEYLLSVKSRPGSESGTVPPAFARANGVRRNPAPVRALEPDPEPEEPTSIDLTLTSDKLPSKKNAKPRTKKTRAKPKLKPSGA